MASFEVVLKDVLNDALLAGALAAEIFVKNPASQATASRLLNAANMLVQTINQQSAPASTDPTATASTGASS